LFAYTCLGILTAGAIPHKLRRTNLPVMVSSYSDVTCDGTPEYVSVLSQGNITYLSFDGNKIEIPGYATDVEFQSDRVLMNVDTDGDGEPDHPVVYRDCTKAKTEAERVAIGLSDVNCDGESERIYMKGNKKENRTTIVISTSTGDFMRAIIFHGYPVGEIAISQDEVFFNLDTDGDGVADKSYGHECDPPGILEFPYFIIDEEPERPRIRI